MSVVDGKSPAGGAWPRASSSGKRPRPAMPMAAELLFCAIMLCNGPIAAATAGPTAAATAGPTTDATAAASAGPNQAGAPLVAQEARASSGQGSQNPRIDVIIMSEGMDKRGGEDPEC